MVNDDVKALYERVATTFAQRIERIFESEETLQAVYTEYFSVLPFDRTERWNSLLRREMVHAWRVSGPETGGSMTAADQQHVLAALASKLDYNLFTQVYLNVQQPFIYYAADDAEKALNDLKTKWEDKKPSPFDPKPKMLKAATVEEQAYNRDLSTVKALKIVAGDVGGRSFRVSPKGSTPALVDSQNVSMLGIGGDQYLREFLGFKAYYFCWDVAPPFIHEVEGKPQHFAAPGIAYPFVSKSGGEILNAVLFSRFIAYLISLHLGPGPEVMHAVLPRMNSVLLVTNADAAALEVVKTKIGLPHILRFHEGQRPDQELTPAA